MSLQEILSQLKGQTIESIDYVEEESSPNDIGFLRLKTTEGKYLSSVHTSILYQKRSQ